MILAFIAQLGRETGILFLEMSQYLLLGLTVAGLLSVVMTKGFVARHIGSRKLGSVIKSALLGVPMPLCSCGVVPTTAYLKRAGASRPAVMSFAISTPQTGVDSITATYGMLGPLFAVFRPVVALITGVIGGLASMAFGTREADGPQEATSAGGVAADEGRPKGLRNVIKSFAGYAYVEAVDDIALQFVVGLAVAGLISLLIPDDFFVGRVFGSGLPAMLIMVIVGVPMYVCSTSSIPIAVALIAKGLSPGAAYVFLVAGPATNAATLAVFTRVLGRRETFIYLGTIIAASLAFGPVMDLIARRVGWVAPLPMTGAEYLSLGPLEYVSGAILGILIIAALVRRFMPRLSSGHRHTTEESNMSDNTHQAGSLPAGEAISMQVEGMTCHHCVANVDNAVRAVPGVHDVSIDLVTKRMVVSGSGSPEAIARAVREAGYTPVEAG